MALISPGYSASIFLKLSLPCTMSRIPKDNVWEFKKIPYSTWDNLAQYPKYKSLWEGSNALVWVWMFLISLEYSTTMLLQLSLPWKWHSIPRYKVWEFFKNHCTPHGTIWPYTQTIIHRGRTPTRYYGPGCPWYSQYIVPSCFYNCPCPVSGTQSLQTTLRNFQK